MNEKKIILGIETSCDETAVSIIEEDKNGKIKILSNVVSSQFDIHKEFGGVVPELAARSHVEKIDLIAKKAITESGVNLKDVSAIAATSGPGLIVCLTIGLNFGKALSASLNIPFINAEVPLPTADTVVVAGYAAVSAVAVTTFAQPFFDTIKKKLQKLLQGKIDKWKKRKKD